MADKTLFLVLKKKWFDMILADVKKEEYRDYALYWIKRLTNSHVGVIGGDFMDEHKVIAYTFKKFDTVTFQLGYQKNAPRMIVECNGVIIGTGRPEWGSKNKSFVIKLGNILSTKNIK